MPDLPSPEQVVRTLREPVNPAHGVWEIYRRVLDGLATLIEQNEFIAGELRQLNEPAKQ